MNTPRVELDSSEKSREEAVLKSFKELYFRHTRNMKDPEKTRFGLLVGGLFYMFSEKWERWVRELLEDHRFFQELVDITEWVIPELTNIMDINISALPQEITAKIKALLN